MPLSNAEGLAQRKSFAGVTQKKVAFKVLCLTELHCELDLRAVRDGLV